MVTGEVRKDFPQLTRLISDKPLVYLDSAATSLKPQAVLNKLMEYYTRYSANVFRGIYQLSEEATQAYEATRQKVATFINGKAQEVVFTRSTTESINLVAAGVGKELQPDDEVVVTIMEHHSNFVPWQQRAMKKGAKLLVWYSDTKGMLDLSDLNKLITRKTKLLSLTAVSNVLGTINPIADIVKIVKQINPKCLVVVDAAQAVPHLKINTQWWGADFIAFSGHKMLGPTGVGVLWGKYEELEKLHPYQYGGEMIKEVHEDTTVFQKPPHKFEAGTPHIAGVIGLGAAIDYLNHLGMDNVRRHEEEITSYALEQLKKIDGLTIYGPPKAHERGGVIAFNLKGTHPHDIAQVLADEAICIRAGHHCAMPLHERLKIRASARASFYIYTTCEDVDALVMGLDKVKTLFS